MSQINISNLTFGYEGSVDTVFDHVSFSLDTDWKLGFIGRNGKGKTTFLNLLMGLYEYSGSICSNTTFDYFPYKIEKEWEDQSAAEFMESLKSGCESWRVIMELDKLRTQTEILYRPFKTLSPGERSKVMLAVLFSGDNDFLLIDEPTNHLDHQARENIKEYLMNNKGYILVSHDRNLLDACIDHVLVLNRKSIEIQNGNFSSWWDNKTKKDNFSRMENEKHLREIASLKRTAEQSSRWAQKNESTKIGFDSVKEHDRCLSTRAYIGAKTKKLQSRVKQYERRMELKIEEKEGLLEDIENPVALKLEPLSYPKEVLVQADGFYMQYNKPEKQVLKDFSFELKRGERVFLHGENGCGKSSFMKAILKMNSDKPDLASTFTTSGILRTGSNLIVSYVNQETGFLSGKIQDFCKAGNLDESLFCAILRQLDMERSQFMKPMEEYSEGQKKKVLIAASLMTPAHLYIWDEPLNYIDIFSRIQIEELILKYKPTMLLVEHDICFQEHIATRVIEM